MNLYDTISRQVGSTEAALLDRPDSNEFPRKRRAVGEILFSIIDENGKYNLGSTDEFLGFFSYACSRAKSSCALNYVDLWVAFMFEERACGTFYELGIRAANDSTTELLEGAFLWNGRLHSIDTDIRNNLMSRRQASVVPDNIRYKRMEDQGGFRDINYWKDSPENATIDFVSFISIQVASTEISSPDFARKNISLICIRGAKAEDYAEILSRLDSHGYRPWCIEFIREDLWFVSDEKLSQAKARLDEQYLPKNQCSHKPVGLIEPNWTRSRKNLPNRIEVVSVHLPKTGGSSLIKGLRNHYGDALYGSYEHMPTSYNIYTIKPGVVPFGTRAVHGHFRANLYTHLNPAFQFTFIRDPVERLVSLYTYLLGQYARNKSPELSFLENVKNIIDFSKTVAHDYVLYFEGFDIGRLDFIGCQNRYSEDLERLSGMLGFELPHFSINLTPKNSIREDIVNDTAIMAKLQDSLRDEYDIYERLLAKT